MVAVEYYNTECTDPEDDDATTTYEIFESLEDAWKFANADKKQFHSMWLGDFNPKRIFKEDDGGWSYEDFSDTFEDSYVICSALADEIEA